MKNKITEKDLREYIQIALLSEEKDGEERKFARGDVGGAFKNLWNTIVGSVKVLASKTKTLLKLTKELVVTTLLKPWEKAEYEKIMDEGKAEYLLIKQKYPDQNLWAHVHEDIKMALFFLYPSIFVTRQAVKYGAKAVKGTYKTLTDPADIEDKIKDAKRRSSENPRFSREKSSETRTDERKVRKNELLIRHNFGSSLLLEDDEKKNNKKDQKEQIAELSKDLNKTIKKVAKKRIPLLQNLVDEMKNSGESDKKAIQNLEKQIKILSSF